MNKSLCLCLVSVLAFVFLFEVSSANVYYEPARTTSVQRYTVLFLCGNNNKYYLSNKPCQTSYRGCNYVCRTSNWCAGFNKNWGCFNGCCKTKQQPRCSYGNSAGPCVNRQCPVNYSCNNNNQCCPFRVNGK